MYIYIFEVLSQTVIVVGIETSLPTEILKGQEAHNWFCAKISLIGAQRNINTIHTQASTYTLLTNYFTHTTFTPITK